MTYKKLFWIAIPISILLGGFITGKVITHRLMEAFSILQGIANIQGAKFRTTKLKEIRVLPDNSEIEKASELVDLLYKVDVDNLEFMQNEEMHPKQVSLGAMKALDEIESNSGSSVPRDEHQSENSN